MTRGGRSGSGFAMACQSREDAVSLSGASPRKRWRILVRFVGRLKPLKPRGRSRFARLPPVAKVTEAFEPPPLPCGDYTLHLRMAESALGLEDLQTQLRDKAGQQIASLTGVYIFRGGDASFLQLCGSSTAPEELRSLAPAIFNEFGRPLDCLKQLCGIRARTGGFLWLSSVQAASLDTETKKEFAQKVFQCLGGPMKRLSLAISPST
mmetsp:Transcript_55594/g.104315  ORF Transcript_55594/g.104315 Transcript_55594/m.104315 type:complete len:208 (+) Transcript_55594:17-640(+)